MQSKMIDQRIKFTDKQIMFRSFKVREMNNVICF